MPNKYLKWATAAALVLGLLLIAYTYSKYRVAPRIAFPNLQVTDVLGAKVRLKPRPGRPLVVVIYASWCHDCARELPKLHAAWSKNLNQVDVALVTDEGMATMLHYRNRHKYPFAFYTLSESFDTYGIHAIPTTYVLSEKGEILFSKVGDVDWRSPDLARIINGGNSIGESDGVKMRPRVLNLPSRSIAFHAVALDIAEMGFERPGTAASRRPGNVGLHDDPSHPESRQALSAHFNRPCNRSAASDSSTAEPFSMKSFSNARITIREFEKNKLCVALCLCLSG